jgi:serine/threonine protein kinase
MNVPGYTVAGEIYRGGNRVVWRAIRDRDRLPVIIKLCAAEYPTPLETAGLRREYELLQELRIRGVPKAYDLEAHRDRLALVLEDAGGSTLKELIARGAIDLARFFDLALQLAATVAEIHRRGVIHKDINPNNVIVNLDTGQARLTDFGIASRLAAEQQRHLQVAGKHPRAGQHHRAVGDREARTHLGAGRLDHLPRARPRGSLGADPAGRGTGPHSGRPGKDQLAGQRTGRRRNAAGAQAHDAGVQNEKTWNQSPQIAIR